MHQFLGILVILGIIAVVTALSIGLVAMIKGGEFNEKYGNKLMRLRIYLQGFALLAFLLFFMAK